MSCVYYLFKESLRRRFSVALHWYAKLIDAKNLLVQQHMDVARLSVIPSGEPGDSSSILRPSNYLRAQCPLCFGSNQFHNPELL